MSLMTISAAINRIKLTSASSPLLVMLAKDGYVDVGFANTVVGKKHINYKTLVIGVYHKEMDLGQIRQEIRRALS
jgi:hypothetical protein